MRRVIEQIDKQKDAKLHHSTRSQFSHVHDQEYNYIITRNIISCVAIHLYHIPLEFCFFP